MTTIISGNEAGLLDSSLALLNRQDQSRNGAMGSGDESFVNVSNGNLVLRHRDTFMPSRGEDFAVVRTYNSRAASSDAHQHDDAGWMISTGVYLDRINDSTGEHFHVTYGDGSVFDYRFDAARGLWVSVHGAGAFETIKDLSLNGNPEVAYVLTRADQTLLSFNKAGRLLSSVDTNGVRMDYEYAADKLVSIRDDEGHIISFIYENGHLQKIADETSAVLVSYKYDAGKLVEVIDRFGHSTKYSYNSFGVIDRIDLPSQQQVDGNVESYQQRSLKFEYAPVNWNGGANGKEYTLTSLIDAEGGVTTFEYDFQFATPATTKPGKNKNLPPALIDPKIFEGGITRTVDALGNNRAYSNDAMYQQWRVENGFYQTYNAQQAGSSAAYQVQVDAIRAQHTLTYTYDKFGNIAEVKDQQGYKTTYTYDAQENLTAITDRNGYAAIASDSSYYRQLRAELGLVDAGGLGKLVSDLTFTEKSALINAFTTRFTYDDRGNVLSRTDNTGNTTKFTFTAFNKVATSTTAEGIALIVSDEGQFQQKRIELGYAALTGDLSLADKEALSELYTTRYQYDAKQNLIQRTDAGGDVTRFEYDVYGNLTQRIVYLDKNDLADAAKQQITQYFYDGFGNNIETVDAEGNHTYRQYDHFGNLLRAIDGNGGVTTYTYDADDRLLSVTDAAGHSTYNTYDAVGNRISFRDANGHLTVYTFDRNNMLVSTVDNADFGSNLDRVTQFSYDVVGNRTSVTDAEGRKTTYVYNNRRQMVEAISAAVSNEHGVSTQYSSKISYDGEGNRVRSINNRGFATDFLYNRDGLLIQQVDASGHTTRYTLDANRNQIMIVAGMQLPVAMRQVVRFTFDQEDQLIGRVDAEDNATHYTYTAAGVRASVTDANNNTTEFEYDRNNRLVKETRPAVTDPVTGALVRYTVLHQYDANGNAVARTDENGHTTHVAFDVRNKAVLVTDANGIKMAYSYDSRHNRTSVAIGVEAHIGDNGHVVIDASDNAQVTTYVYDEFNQLVAKTDGVGNALAASDAAQYQEMRQALGYAAQVVDLSAADKNALKAAYTDRMSYDRVGNTVSVADHFNQATSFQYDSLNRLVKQTDALQNETTFGYDGNGNRVWQQDSLSRLITQTFDSVNRVVRATDPLGVATVRAYDAFSNLIEQTRAADTGLARTNRFEYDLNNRLVRNVDAEGHEVSYQYDAVGNRLLVTDARGNATGFVYDALNRNIKIIDPLNFDSRMEYDGVGNTISIIDARGGVQRMAYDAGNRVIQTTDAEGRVTRYEYDALGNQTKLLTAFGTADEEATTFEYDAQNNLRAVVDAKGVRSTNNFDRVYNRTEVTDGNGHTTITEFDAIRRAVSVTNAEGEKTSFTYDAVGNRLTTTDALGRVSTYAYDANNRATTATAADGVETRYAYDELGNRVSITAAANTADAATTTFVYDLDDKLIEQIDPLNHSIRYEYDANHNRTRVIDAEGHASDYFYDANNRVVQIVDALGNDVHYAYDGNGNRIQVTDARGNISTTYYNANNEVELSIDNEGYATAARYDNNGNVVSTTLYATAVTLPVTPGIRPVPVVSAMDHTIQFRYDKLNQLVEKTDAEGYATQYTYDVVGNRTRTELFLDIEQTKSEVTRAWYDDVNRQVALLSAEGYLTTFTYDDVGNRLSRTQYDQRVVAPPAGAAQPVAGDAGRTTHYAYDLVNKLSSEESPLGVSTAYEYDKRGNRTAVIEAANTADERRTELRYDAANRLTDEINALDTVTHYALDADGNVVTRFDGYGSSEERVANSEYDANHRLVRQIGTDGLITEMSYDAAGNLTHKIIGVGEIEVRTESFEYDRNNRMIATVNGEGERTEFGYDAAGNLVIQTQAPGLLEERTTRSEFDRDNRLVVTIDAMGLRTEFRYDGAGNKVEAIQARGVFGLERHSFYAYDLDNRLVESTDAMGGVTRYEYDALGNQTKITNANGGVQINTFDVLGRMESSLSAGGVLTQNVYDLRNNVLSTTQSWEDGSDARTTSYQYDLLNRQTSITDGEGYTTNITYDLFGNQTQIDHGLYLPSPGDANYDSVKAGRAHLQSNRFTYDLANRMLSMTDAEDNITEYGYDAVGNRTSMTEAANTAPRTTSNTYDLANRLIETRTPEGGIARQTYDEVGNKVAEDLLQSSGLAGETWIHRTYEHDLNGRMIAEIDAYGVRTEHEYDIVGNQITHSFAVGTADERVVRMEYDLDGRKTADIDGLNNRTEYAYDSMGNRIKVTDAIGRVARYYYDGSNQLTTLVDPENFVSTFTYDSAGNRIQERVHMTRLAGSADDQIAPVAVESSLDRVTETIYNRVNKAIAKIASDDTRHEMAYNGVGSLIKETLFANTDSPRSREYGYDLNNRLTHFVDADGTQTTFTYDGANNRTSHIIISSTDVNTVRATYMTYDLNNRKIGETFDPEGLNFVQSLEYDKLGNVVRKTDGNGHTTSYAYDLNNRLLSETNALGLTMEYGYDKVGNRSTVTDARGNTIEFEYDGNNRLVKETKPEVQVYVDGLPSLVQPTSTLRYDAAGNRIEVKDANGYITRSYFDGNNRLVAEVNADNVLTEYRYNGAGEKSESMLYMSRLDASTLDVATRPTPPSGDVRLTSFQYDLGGRLIRVLHPAVTITTLIGADTDHPQTATVTKQVDERTVYDSFGNAVESFDRNGNRSVGYYDLNGRKTAAVDAMGYLVEWDYDSQGNVTEQRLYSRPLNLATVDSAVRPVQHDGDVYVVSRLYDAANRLVEEKSAQISVYDPVSRTSSLVRPTTLYTYDAIGNQISKTIAAGTSQQQVEYSYYDAANRKIAVINANRVLHLYQFDANGNQTAIKRFFTPVDASADLAALNGATDFTALVAATEGDQATVFTYDAVNRMTDETDRMGSGAADDLKKTYGYDASYNRTFVTNEDGYVSTNAYDGLNRVLKTVGPDGNGTIAEFDAAGNQVRVYTGKIDSRALPVAGSAIHVSLGTNLNVAWEIPSGAALRSWVVYDTASHSSPNEYARRSTELSNIATSQAQVSLDAIGANVYFRVVTQDIAGNLAWSEEKTVTIPPRFHDLSVAQPASGTLVVTARFDAGVVAPTLYYGSHQNPNTPVAFAAIGNGIYQATLTGVSNPQELAYRLGWSDAGGQVYSSAETSFASAAEHTAITSEVSQGVIGGTTPQYTIEVTTKVPAALADTFQVVQAQWRLAGSNGGYSFTAVQASGSAAGYVSYTLQVADNAPLGAGTYEIILRGASATGDVLLDTFEFTVGPDAMPATMRSISWNAPQVGDAQYVTINGQLVPSTRAGGRLVINTGEIGAGTHDYDVLYTQSTSTAHTIATDTTPVTEMKGTPPVAVVTGYNLTISADFAAEEAAQIQGDLKLAYRAKGATTFSAPIAMSSTGANGYALTLDKLAAGQYEVQLSYTDSNGNEVIADWLELSASDDVNYQTTSKTILARETNGTYQVGAAGAVQITTGLYTGPIDDSVMASTLTLNAMTSDANAGSLATDGSATGYFLSNEYNALNAKIASNGQDGLWRLYGVDGNGNAVETKLYGTHPGQTAAALDQAPALSYAAFDGRNRKTAEFGIAFTPEGESAARHPTTRVQYNVFDKVIAQTDSLGNTKRSEYNALGALVKQIDASMAETTVLMDVLGHETAVVDALGHTKHKYYDGLGRLVREIDATGYETHYTYDVFDRRVTVTDGLGALTAAIDGDHTTRYHYDQRDRIVQIDQAQGWHLANDAGDVYEAERIRLGYTAYRDLLEQTALGARPPVEDPGVLFFVRPTQLLSEAERLAAKQTLAAQGIHSSLDLITAQQKAELVTKYVMTASYDGRNNRTATVDANGHTTREVYDALGRVEDTITMQNGVEVHNRRQYDIYGNLAVEVDGDGRMTTYNYGGFARLIQETDAGGESTYYVYDRFGQQILETSSGQKNIEREYDLAGHLISIKDIATGVSTVFGYNANGQRMLERITTPDNAHNRDITYQYDQVGRQVRWADSVTGLHLNYSWDAAGNQRRVYTDAGYANAVDHSYAYDAANRIHRVDNTGGAMIAEYGYDAAGNRTSFSNGTAVATYSYDSMTRVVGAEQAGKTSSWAYDMVGNVLSYTAEDGKVSTYQYYENNRNWYSKTGDQVTTQALDYAGHTTQMTLTSAGKAYYYSYTYLADGREDNIRGYGAANGNSSSSYDANHNKIGVNLGVGDGMDRAETSTFVYSNEGKILYRYHDTGKGSEIETTEYLYANGYQVGETGTDTKGEAKTELDVGRYNQVQNISKDFPGMSVTRYVARDGDTLQSIAAAVYGNPSLWYLIADANGMMPTDPIKAGTEIKIPNSARVGDITADTHRVYNESEIIGSTLPNLKTPPPPKKNKCMQFVMIIVVIIVAIVAWYVLPELISVLGPTFGAASTVVAAGIVAAGASIVIQGAAIALGFQEKFSWKAVATGALTAMLTAGVGMAVGTIGQTAQTVGEMAQYARVAAAALSVAGDAVKQFITSGKITSWASLVMAGFNGYAQAGSLQAATASTSAVTDAAADAAKQAAAAMETIKTVTQYASPWVQLAETAIRNDGKLTPSDWAAAVGSTLATALGDRFDKALFGKGNTQFVSKMIVGGALSAIDKKAGTNHLISAAADWLGDKMSGSANINIPSGMVMSVFNGPEAFASSFGGWVGQTASNNYLAAASKREQEDRAALRGARNAVGNASGDLPPSWRRLPDGSLTDIPASSNEPGGLLDTVRNTVPGYSDAEYDMNDDGQMLQTGLKGGASKHDSPETARFRELMGKSTKTQADWQEISRLDAAIRGRSVQEMSPHLTLGDVGEYISGKVSGFGRGVKEFFTEDIPNLPAGVKALVTDPINTLEAGALQMQNEARGAFLDARGGNFRTIGELEGNMMGKSAAGTVLGVSGGRIVDGIIESASSSAKSVAVATAKTPDSGTTSIPTYTELQDLAANTLDFSTKPNGAVFWSGADNMNVAQWWAKLTGKTTLEQTVGGQYLNSLKLFDNLPGSDAAQIWDIASVRFANGASGNVNVFNKGATQFGAYGERTWWRLEQPALQTNPNVTKIRQWNWTMDPKKLP